MLQLHFLFICGQTMPSLLRDVLFMDGRYIPIPEVSVYSTRNPPFSLSNDELDLLVSFPLLFKVLVHQGRVTI
jgi:hypothetical protein